MTLGEQIVKLRTARGISQADLAEAMEVSRQSVSKWETGASVPDLDKLVRLSEYFGLSLDRLVKGGETEPADPPDPPAEERTRSAPERTKAQNLGIFLLCLSAVTGLLCLAFFGIGGLLFVVPILIPGLICCFVKKHPVLKAVWAAYLPVSLYLHLTAGISPSHIRWTFQWTAQANYAILVFSWIWAAAAIALVAGTAFALRKKEWTWTLRQTAGFVLGLILFVLGSIPGVLSGSLHSSGLQSAVYLGSFYLQLAGLTVVCTGIARWLSGRKKHSGRPG